MQKKNLYLLLLILGTAFWGISFIFVKQAVSSSISPFIFIFYKFLIAGLCLSVIFASQLRHITKKTFKITLLCGIPLLLATVLQTIGIKHTTVSNSAFITGLDVILIPILKFIFYRKRVIGRIWLACFIALIGLYIIAVKEDMNIASGDIITAGCALGFAVYILQVGKYSDEENPMPSVILLMLFCSLGALIFAIADNNSVWIPETEGFWTAVLFAGLPATAYMYAVQNAGQRYLGEEKVALTYLFEPIFATLAAVIFLGEDFTVRILIGGILIVSAMFIAEVDLSKIRRKKTVN